MVRINVESSFVSFTIHINSKISLNHDPTFYEDICISIAALISRSVYGLVTMLYLDCEIMEGVLSYVYISQCTLKITLYIKVTEMC